MLIAGGDEGDTISLGSIDLRMRNLQTRVMSENTDRSPVRWIKRIWTGTYQWRQANGE